MVVFLFSFVWHWNDLFYSDLFLKGMKVLPLALHLPWEADDGWRDLEALAPALADVAVPWGEFLDEVAASRAAAPPGS